MKFRNMTGYMLGNAHCVHKPGAPWTTNDVPVWICPTIRKALEILERSHINHLDGNALWTTIYRVVARDIECIQMKNGLWFTDRPTKIYVDEPVLYKEPMQLTEEQLLARAAEIMPTMHKITRKAFKERRR